MVIKGLLYPDVDLATIVSDQDYNKINSDGNNGDSVRAYASYSPSSAVSYAMSYYGIPNYKNYKVLLSGGTLVDCANFVSQCLSAGYLSNTSSWYYTKSSTVCTCATFNPYHTCRDNDAFPDAWNKTSFLRPYLTSNSYGYEVHVTSMGTPCSAMTSGDLLFVLGGDHVYICVGYNSSTGKLRFADHDDNGGAYGSISEKNIYYMSNYYIINMY